MRLLLLPGVRRASARGGAAGTSALGCECPPASALGRRLLLDFAPKGTRTRRSGLPGASERHKKAWTTGVSPLKRGPSRSEEHTSELQSLMRISYAVFCLKKKTTNQKRI